MAAAAGGAPAPVDVVDRGAHPLPVEQLAAAVKQGVDAARKYCGRPHMEVTVVLCGDAEIARLHGEHFDDPSPTDVITFPLDETSADLVVSVETAMRVASDQGHDPQAEVVLYAVHGTLHACGLDDIEAAERAAMRAAERAVLESIGVVVSPVDAES